MRFALLVVLLLAFLPAGASAAKPQTRIVGGTAAAEGAYPAQAEIVIADGTDAFLCGGTLVAPQWILTAAHCVIEETTGAQFDAAAFTVRLGSAVLGAGAPFAVDRVAHPSGFDAESLAYDVAVLHLTAPAPQTPLPMITAATASAARPGTLARAIGWGTTSEGGQTSPTLLEVDVPIVSHAACDDLYGDALFTASMLCAGYDAGGKDACQGDSGGPLMVDTDPGAPVRWAIAGIVSTGDGCAEPGRYGVYTDLLNTSLRSGLDATLGAPAGVPAATPATIATPAPTIAAPTPTPLPATAPDPVTPTPRTGVWIGRCSTRACAFRVSLLAAGTVRARVTVSGVAARRLGLRGITLAAGRQHARAGEHQLTLRLPRSVGKRMRARHLKTIGGRLTVTAPGVSATQRVRVHR